MVDQERIRLVVLGGAGVGKSAICKQFLFNSFCPKYRTTVEDLYSKEFNVGSTTIKVDILDTCGDQQFPAMRRLSIATAHAFLFVYSIACEQSFEIIKQNFEEVREQREDYQTLPIVIAGNKLDLAPDCRHITVEDASEWVYCELPKMRVKLVECSAKDNVNVREVFKCFLGLSRFLNGTEDFSTCPLKRRSSAYVSHTKASRRAESPVALSVTAATSVAKSPASPTGRGNHTVDQSKNDQDRPKPRSRSLIRRCSRKTKQQIRDSGAVDDCNVS
ncbi:ras-related protein Rap-2c [Daktulosphaira vitifoliae]|uniref:ras-related protein Rap-2c n=1 Tax=Daktulosphaira vitifoliae TaxID=58002 RepID=UPI0021AAFFFF|nr:ras-related protein Rap-2c [Daktulosphaira vitifoliae]XP_050546189.1 ras-related protein Rap-2c [Daktulosphaira vitifoliae]XP_050546190.1 ras-related protein Rap-2c [Daktulosphaira vitifoliae]XP_050546191.1 ras-related protein Rap-2c [Daktulosphaira vitifoliae]